MNDNWPIPQTQHWIGPQENVQSTLKKVPIHRQMMQYFEAQYKNALLQPGDKLPSERALSAQFSITRMTVRQALIRLEAEGLIFREQRRGWFFSLPRITYDPTLNTSFTENIAKQGRTLETTVLFKKKINASRWLSQILDCDIGAPVFLVNRKKAVDGRVVLVEQIYIKVNRCTTLFNYRLDQSMTDLLADKFDLTWLRRNINMRPTALPEKPAKALGVVAGTPGFYLSRLFFDHQEEIIEFDQEFWRHDAIDINVSAVLKDDR